MTKILAFSGLPAAGKSVAVDMARECNIPVYSMGDEVRKRAADDLQPPTDIRSIDEWAAHSDEIGEWATEQRERHGDEIVSEWTCETIQKSIDAQQTLIVVDGIRSVEERDVFLNNFDSITIVHITAPFNDRLARITARGRDGEEEFTKAKLQERDEREIMWGVARLGNVADHHINNASDRHSLQSFKEELVSLIERENP